MKLQLTNKAFYIDFCKRENIPIFSQPYWLDAVCGKGNWDVALVKSENEIFASLPYFIEKKKIFTMCWMPHLTQKLGPHIVYPSNQKSNSKFSYEKKIITELLSQLPKHDLFIQNFGENYSYWSPLHWLNFKQTTRYSFVLEDITDMQKVRANYSSSLRNKIKKGEKNITITTENNISEVYRLVKSSFIKTKNKPKFDFNIIKNINEKLLSLGQSLCLFAENEENEKVATAYLVWDEKTCYYILGGANPKYIHLQPQSVLLDRAIEIMSEKNKKFDFEGSMLEGIEKFFRSFGAIPQPYFTISKINSTKLKMINFIKGNF